MATNPPRTRRKTGPQAAKNTSSSQADAVVDVMLRAGHTQLPR
jgi:hypothetical protein